MRERLAHSFSTRREQKGRFSMWQQQIHTYTPFNEQEEADKQVILNSLTIFDEVLTRENKLAHFTCSGFVMNPARTHVLMIHHNIYNAWGWTGGHADGESDFLAVAHREIVEETGVEVVTALSEAIISLDVLPVHGHMKKGQYITPHLHFNVTYVFEVAFDAAFIVNEEENSGVAWIAVEEMAAVCNEAHMLPIYDKIVRRVQTLSL